jgi:glyoxylase-like metal-dependent hydrolase (beta-lactamase superfamily II)
VVFAGDVLHHPLQIAHPDWNTGGCLDPVQARLTRGQVLAMCADHGDLLAPAHFRSPYVFGVERAGATFALTVPSPVGRP